MSRLRYRGHEIMVLHVLDRDELEFPFDGPTMFRDIEGDEELFAEPWAFRRAYQEAMRNSWRGSTRGAATAATITCSSSPTSRWATR